MGSCRRLEFPSDELVYQKEKNDASFECINLACGQSRAYSPRGMSTKTWVAANGLSVKRNKKRQLYLPTKDGASGW